MRGASFFQGPDDATINGRKGEGSPRRHGGTEGFVFGYRFRWAQLGFMALFLMATTASAQAGIVGTVHQGSVQEGSIQWRSRVVVDMTPDGEPVRAVLTAPLDPKFLTYPEAVEPVLTEGQVTSLMLPSCEWGRPGALPASTSMPRQPLTCSTDIYVIQPISGPRGAVHLQPPMLEGVAMQIVDVWGPEELMFIPDPKVGLEKRLAAFTPAGVDKDLPRRWDQRLGFARRGPAHKPLYFQSTDSLKEGIAGELTSEGDRMRHGAIVAGVVFAAIVTALITAFLRLSRVARVERAEAELKVNLRRSEELLNDMPTSGR